MGVKNKIGFYDYSQPGELFSTNSNTDLDPDGYRKIVVERLWGYYIQSVASILKTSVCTREELRAYIKDYMGTDNDPFILNN